MSPDLLCRATSRGAVRVGKALHGVAKVPQQMPLIGDLDRRWRTLSNPVRVGASAITGDNLHARTAAPPACDRCSLPIGQEIDDVIGFEIHHHRAVAATPPPCPIVNPQNPRGRSGFIAE